MMTHGPVFRRNDFPQGKKQKKGLPYGSPESCFDGLVVDQLVLFVVPAVKLSDFLANLL